MTIKDLAEILSEQGYDIKLRKRADGGYIISKIDGVSFKGASGNIQARKIAGVSLSHARAYQLERIRPPKRVAPMMRQKAPLPAELVKKLRQVQREWRKKHEDISGTLSMRGLRYQYETYGKEEALASLDKGYRYAQGFAYFDNVNWLIERITSYMNKVDESEQKVLQKVVSKIQQKIMTFKEEWINPIYQDWYEYAVHHTIEVDEFARRVDEIMM